MHTANFKLKEFRRHLRFAIYTLQFTILLSPAIADQVIMKDGTVYKGKILIDSDKAILIGNPPFDPNSYLLESKDIEKIIYEQYHPNAPAERKRGLIAETRLTGNVFSSSQLSLDPAAGLYGGLGFRVHPMFEIDGGIDWIPALHSGGALSISDSTNPGNARRYENFWAYSGEISGRLYPFYEKKWKAEPYVTAGYDWNRLIPSGSGDNLTGSGYLVGFGAIYPLMTHIYLEARFVYQSSTFDTVDFLGHSGQINPEIDEHRYMFSTGVSYRL